MWPQTTAFLRQVVLEANKAKLPHIYLPYVFWNLAQNRKGWPNMHPKAAKGLRTAVDLVKSQGDMPNYKSALSLPPPELEAAVDRTIQGLAMWTLNGMSPTLLKGYATLLKKWGAQMARAVGETLPADKAGMYLKLLFEEYLRKQPAHFLDGMLLERVVQDLVL